MRKYFVRTFGCQMNEHDSETIAGILEGRGYIPAASPEDADIVVFNTCCVRENPERKLYGQVAKLRRLKQENPDLIIAVSGCMVQQAGEAERIARELPHVDLVFGTMNLHRLPELLAHVEAGRRTVEIWDDDGGVAEDLPVRRADSVSAWVTIMHGCSNFCAYCIVPYVRGRERSRSFEDIVAEVQDLGRQGFREVVLLGQNVNAYGRDLADGRGFADLLRTLDGTPGILRIRYTTSHPRDFSQELIDTIADSSTVCEHFHLPLQAGSDSVLSRMNRGYTRDGYMDLVRRIRRAVPGASITTDIIVGFPGETDEDFAQTLDMVREVRFDSAFTFVFSPRRGTPAASMEDRVPEDVKRARIQELVRVQEGITTEINRALEGKTVEVLVEGESKTNPSMLAGRTRANKLVVFPPDPRAERGRLVQVRITRSRAWTQTGEVVGG